MLKSQDKKFNYDNIPAGYYDVVAARERGIRSYWHWHKFAKVMEIISERSESILDIGCFAGTFLAGLSKEKVRFQVGVDILMQQIEYAKKKYQNEYRKFYYIKDINALDAGMMATKFENISVIEVLEHLTENEIGDLLNIASQNLKAGGKLIITTPNYTGLWPLIEIILNRFSTVKYEEQHITKFGYYKFENKLKTCWPEFGEVFYPGTLTTSHSISPVFAIISFGLAKRITKLTSVFSSRFPFGSLIIASFIKK